MRYIVSRTSGIFEGEPIEGSYKIARTRVDRRTTNDPAKIPAYKGESAWWFETGENHRIENGMICRDMGQEEKWVIDIDDVLDFVKENGQCVVYIDSDGWPNIEIYDTYRE